ncbi:hypothetical protein [Paenibacillus sp. FSL E2-0151]|uniref:hypothetical protein n=1 Tax=Paenibacillus sp. FSL E2-0151 TaxID=2921357 RepID=UPI0030ED5848
MEFEIDQVVTFKNKTYAVHADMETYIWLIDDKGELLRVDAWGKQAIKMSDIEATFDHINGYMVPVFN